MAGPVGTTGPHLGRVTSFDATRGLGVIAGDVGVDYAFHATAIADGSRRIAEGTRVSYSLVRGHGGRHEAGRVVALVDSSDTTA